MAGLGKKDKKKLSTNIPAAIAKWYKQTMAACASSKINLFLVQIDSQHAGSVYL
jgi:hypothetical protein